MIPIVACAAADPEPSTSEAEAFRAVSSTASGVKLTVLDARELGTDVTDPARGARQVELRAELENVAAATPLAVSTGLFVLSSDALLERTATSSDCDGSVRVARGGRYRCSIRFTMPWAERVQALKYAPTA